tara:strand:- start:12058 stop:12642 length:585 start_codon:yes stop_codon:yes gene_type:complete
MFVVGISGVARSGKNLLCDLLRESLRVKGITSKQFALAAELKNDCQEFLQKKCNMNVWTDITQDKSKFRDFLVWYGSLKRQQSNGRYWIEKLNSRLESYSGDVAFITDVRYDSYNKDEFYWVTEEKQGVIIHLKRIINNMYVEPANDHEKFNDRKIQRKSDINIVWRTFDDPYCEKTVMKIIDDTTDRIINFMN